jgi:hypothetical protein
MALVCSYGKQFSLTPFINIIAFVGVNLFWVTCVCSNLGVTNLTKIMF